MTRTLLLGARVLDPGAPPGPAAIEIIDGTITHVGSAAPERGPHVVRLDGALVTPAFVDAHVHATATGLLADGLDLTSCPGPRALLDAVAVRVAQRPGALVWGHGWQDQHWPDGPPTRAALDRAAAGAPVYLSRIDVHSALVSTALLDRAPGVVGTAGWSDGPLTADAHHHARRAALDAVDDTTRDNAQRAFLAAAAALGIGTVHECAGPDISSAADLAALRRLPGLDVVGYWGEAVTGADEARSVLAATGAHGLAGDLFIDGSIGSRTAALTAPYTDAPGCVGHRHLDADAVAAHVTACTEVGTQAGFHVIGDAAAAALVDGLERAAHVVHVDTVRAARHRVEHLEMVDATQIAALARFGVVASVQPLFDAFWGGPAGMYAERLGARAAGMNPFAALHAAGVALALGSDAPVTPLGPWAAIDAAVAHRTPGSGLTHAQAVAAHTVGGHRAAGDDDPLAGRLVAGAPASYAVWEGTTCLRTVQCGRLLHDTLHRS